MDSLILDLQIVFYFQLFLSANVRHTSSAKNNNCSVLLGVKNLYGCSESFVLCNFNTKRQIAYVRKTKRLDVIFLNYLIISSAGLLLTCETYTSWIILHLSSDPLASCENIGFQGAAKNHLLPPPLCHTLAMVIWGSHNYDRS